MKDSLYEFCISPIVEWRRLEEFALRGHGKITEGRRWKTGQMLLDESRKSGTGLPVILSDAAYNSERVLLWGVLQKLEIDGDRTTAQLGEIQRVRGNHGRQDLTLKSSGKPIRPNFIRPYAICHTPTFLR